MADFVSTRKLERPIVHRVQEIEEFPQALNISQMWNWHASGFIAEARTNLTEEERTGTTSRYTTAELDELEKTLKEHEKWLNEWVEKQKSVPLNHDPVIETSEMRRRAKVLETHLQRLVQKKKPPRKLKSTSSSSTTQDPQQTDEPVKSPHDEL
jgi:hypoxia up-regulated 1